MAFMDILKKKIAEFGGVSCAAREWRVDRGFLWKVLNGEKPVPAALADKLGYEWRLVRRR